MNTLNNQIGLEAEFLLRKDGKLVYPADYGFSHDEFCILGEFRALPGKTREKTIANFIESYFEVVYKAEKRGLTLDISNGWETVTPQFFAEILRKMGSKSVAQCQNIYGTDILTLNDAVFDGDKIVARYLSCGLHIHFSSEFESEVEYTRDNYETVNLPLNIAGAEAVFNLFKKSDQTKLKVTARAHRMTKPVVKHIVKSLDDQVLSVYVRDLPNLKYRNPGFFEMKGWGFEYRSLPFNKNVLENIHSIVDRSFSLLEDL